MSHTHPILACVAAVALALAGCQGDRGYPDRSPDTSRRVDDIRRNAADQKEAIADREQKDRERLAFREQQIRDKHQARRDEASISHDQELVKRAAERREIELRLVHEEQRLLNEARDRKRLSTDDQAATIDADAASAAARVKADAAEDLEPLATADRDAGVKLEQRILDIDREEAQELSALEQERAKMRNVARADRVKVDQWAADELAQVETNSRPADDHDASGRDERHDGKTLVRD